MRRCVNDAGLQSKKTPRAVCLRAEGKRDQGWSMTMLDLNPQIVHLFWAWTGDEGLYLKQARQSLVDGEVSAGLFETNCRRVDCVVPRLLFGSARGAIFEHINYVDLAWTRQSEQEQQLNRCILRCSREQEARLNSVTNLVVLQLLSIQLTPILLRRSQILRKQLQR